MTKYEKHDKIYYYRNIGKTNFTSVISKHRRKTMIKLSLVVPCYNESKNVGALYDAVKTAFEGHIDSYEMVFINDGSRDDTYSVLKKIHEQDKSTKVINFSRNFGKEAAMYAGLHKAEGEYVTIIDADLQQLPKYVVEMVDFLDNNSDYDAVAMYQENRNEPRLLSFFKKGFYKLINAMCEIEFRSNASDFRTLRRPVVDAILNMPEYFRFSKGIFSWVGFNTQYMPYVAEKRATGKSSWSFRKLFKYAIEGITAFTTFPLKLSAYFGGGCSVAALIYMIVVIIQKLFCGIDIPGYATLVVLILFIGGAQLMMLGVVGQYIAKMYIEGKRRPVYLIKNYLSGESDEKK